jgi:hypothetical protein
MKAGRAYYTKFFPEPVIVRNRNSFGSFRLARMKPEIYCRSWGKMLQSFP